LCGTNSANSATPSQFVRHEQREQRDAFAIGERVYIPRLAAHGVVKRRLRKNILVELRDGTRYRVAPSLCEVAK
jgi:hypothetical protein